MLAARKEDEATVRTCAGCRARDAQDALVRFAVGDGEPPLAPDPFGRLGGRGVSLHPRRECFERAARRGGLARALRRPVSVRPEQLARMAAAQYRRRADGLLLAARRSRGAAVGTDAVRDAIRSGRIALLVVAVDAANRREELSQAAERLGRACVLHGTRAHLGALLGREEVAVVAIEDDGIAEELNRAVSRADALETVGDGCAPDREQVAGSAPRAAEDE